MRNTKLSKRKPWVKCYPSRIDSTPDLQHQYKIILAQQIRNRPANQISFYQCDSTNIKKSLHKRHSILPHIEQDARNIAKKKTGQILLLDQIYSMYRVKTSIHCSLPQESDNGLDTWEKEHITLSTLYHSRNTELPEMIKIRANLEQLYKRNNDAHCLRINENAKFYENQTKRMEASLKQAEFYLQQKRENAEAEIAQLMIYEGKMRADIVQNSTKQIRLELVDISKKIDQLKDTIKICKSQYKEIKDLEIYMYKMILNIGRDVRSSGILWIIRKLDNMDVRTEEKDLPKFLDMHNCTYLLQQAQLYSGITKAEIKRQQLLEEYNKNHRIEPVLRKELGILSTSADDIKKEKNQKRAELFEEKIYDLSNYAHPPGGKVRSIWRDIASPMVRCKETSATLIYNKIKTSLRAYGNSHSRSIASKELSSRRPNLRREQIISEFKRLEKQLKRMKQDISQKRERERRRVMQELSESEIVKIVSVNACLFGTEAAERAFLTSDRMKKKVRLDQ